ncbi:hypothetical protein PsorP6_011173 [Peronosclerospora sorghi]|uniref:Uncharacterized protein n=1 Tax=Peronosclerospora sorghi TaxID=230839 RepID=A0ACC0VUW7_9STRA|nr:hypothetical protein PsorP6_011173 [Peronosclerospora sorghi]
MKELEAMKSDFMTMKHRIVLGFLERRLLSHKIHAAFVLQSYARMSLDFKDFHFQRRAIVKIQRGWKKYKAILMARTTYHSGENDWQDEHVGSSDDGFDDAPTSFRAGRDRSVVERMESFKVAHSDSRGSVERLNELSARAKNFMKPRSGSGSTAGSSGISLEDEKSMLMIENRNLKYDLELMREQCIELQAIILEINKARTPASPIHNNHQ